LSGLAAGSTVDVIIGDASTGAKKVLRVSSAGETMGRLEPGIYTVGGAAVPGYSAPPSQRVTVTAGRPSTVTLTYTAIPGVRIPPAQGRGGLTVRVSGLPVGTSADITIISPTGARKTLGLSDVGRTFGNVEPGTYTIIGATAEGYSAPASQRVTVIAGQLSTATLAYTPIAGSLTVSVRGLPATASASVTVTGQRFRQTIPLTGTSSQTLHKLTPGTYTVRGLGTGGYSASDQAVSVAAAQNSVVTLAYIPNAPIVGSLMVTMNGLPATLSASVTVTGPGFTETLALAGRGTQILRNLTLGTYTVRGNATAGYSTPDKVVVVAAGRTSIVTLAYTPAVGSFTIAVHGLPATLSATVTVTGQGFNQAIPLAAAGTQTLPKLMPGMYTVSGARSGGYSAPNQTVEVVAGRTSTVTLAYAPIVGSLTVAVHGLPATLAASVTVTGQGFSQTVPVAGTGTHVLPDLTPGTYTVSAGGAVGYSAPSESAAVASGQSPTVTLVFMPIAQSPRWSLWQIVAMLGLALMLLIAALSMRRRRAVETASVIQIRVHRDSGTQRIYVDGRPLEPGVTRLTVPDARLRTLDESASQGTGPRRDPFGQTEMTDHV